MGMVDEVNRWQVAFEDALQSVQHDHDQAEYSDDLEDIAVRRYTKDLLGYLKQIKPR